MISLVGPRAAGAEILAAELRVDGMACPFCAFGIEKKLRAVNGVEAVKVSLDEGRIRLAFSPTNRASIDELERAVQKAGFTLVSLRVDFRGTLRADRSQPLIEDRVGIRFRLLERRDGGLRAISKERLSHEIRNQPDDSVVVGGRVERDGSPPGLILGGAPQ